MHIFQRQIKQQEGKELFLRTQIAISMNFQFATIILLVFQIFYINKPNANVNYNGRFGINNFDYNGMFDIILNYCINYIMSLCNQLFDFKLVSSYDVACPIVHVTHL